MAKQSNARTRSSNVGAPVIARPQSHRIMEGLLLLSALSILCVLFSFFTLELKDISEHAFDYGEKTENAVGETPSTAPPRVEVRVLGSNLLIVEVDETGTPTTTLYSSDLSDDIADFTLFAIPQTGYQGYIYVRPILDGKLPNLKVYPLNTATGALKAATLNVPADDFVLSGDETLVGTLDGNILSLYAIEDGAIIASGTIPNDWWPFVQNETVTLSISENACLSLTLAVPNPDLTPFPVICP